MEKNKIYLGDCKEVLKTFPDNCIDLTVTSPPYGNLRDYCGYTFDFESIAKELYRVTKQGGVVVWVVNDTVVNGGESGESFKQVLKFMDIGFNLYDTMIYLKNGSQYPEKRRYYQCFEYMFVLSKGRPKTVNLITDRENKWQGSWGKRSVRKKDGSLVVIKKVPYKKYGIRYNVWKINCGYGFTTKDKEAYKHPAMFPEKLAEDHILSWSNEDDTVLDPMAGSGTTLKMAKKNNRNYIGIEISEEYINIINQRLN